MVTLAHSGRPRNTLAIMAAPSSWRNGPCWTSVKMLQLGIWPKNSNMWYIRISQVEASSPYGATKRPCWDMLNPLQQPYVYNVYNMVQQKAINMVGSFHHCLQVKPAKPAKLKWINKLHTTVGDRQLNHKIHKMLLLPLLDIQLLAIRPINTLKCHKMSVFNVNEESSPKRFCYGASG